MIASINIVFNMCVNAIAFDGYFYVLSKITFKDNINYL